MQENFWPFLVFVTVMCGTPGPGNLSLMALGQTVGFKKSVPFLSGVITGGIFMDILIVIGLGELFLASPKTAEVLKISGMIYILYLAWKIMRLHARKPEKAQSFKFVEGLILHPLNPKHYAMTISAFSQFADPAAPRFMEIFIFVATFTAGASIFHSLWCLTGESFIKLLRTPTMRYTVNISMVILMVGATVYALYK
ncbi:LysE family translocator [Maridesulfovibrio hydrothermalis]|uniref:Lysine exporter protein (LYSE/YGGA) n=1 Tax=Maridesulfovibrio hydrothermalis AM13 = DSM 14728 TaxID=1121451 RepID=L0RC15_9BACT|nr:LysE family translocator [Maridesulfovibrio hydrothermalis]CCO23096.1 Lysine exporter protein (LYSE/YGGA) [Maridesulfovibrio hydrothermalis AM13 = DSM 14728]